MVHVLNCRRTLILRTGAHLQFKRMSCTISNLIHVIICVGCGENYTGHAADIVRQRMTVHRQQIREPKYQCSLVSEHIRNCGVNKYQNFTLIPFYKLKYETTEQERETKKTYLFITVKPFFNFWTGIYVNGSLYVYCFHTKYQCVIRYFCFPYLFSSVKITNVDL